jgi:hypothetical protein
MSLKELPQNNNMELNLKSLYDEIKKLKERIDELESVVTRKEDNKRQKHIDDQDKEVKKQILLTEYQACQDMKNHIYNEIWQSGAILIGASIIAIAYAFTIPKEDTMTIIYLNFPERKILYVLAVILVVSWIWITRRLRSFQKLHNLRLLEIEDDLCKLMNNGGAGRVAECEKCQMQHHLASELFKNRQVRVNDTLITVSKPRTYYRLLMIGAIFLAIIILLTIT